MRTTIFKYLKSSNPNAFNNYFDRSSALALYDKFIMVRHLRDGFPIFREEWSQEDNINIIKTGFFDLKLSIIMSETSEVNGKNIYEYFENFEGDVGAYTYLVVCETENIERSYCGVIDINSLKTDEDVTKNNYFITMSVTGIEKEFVELMKSSKLIRLINDAIFETEYLPKLLYWASPLKLIIDSQLDLYTKLGFNLTISKDLHNNLWDSNLDTSGTYCVLTHWEAFKNFIIGYAFKFRIILSHIGPSGPVFKIKLFFRSEGVNSAEIKTMAPKRGLVLEGSNYIAMFYTHRVDGQNAKLEHFTGIIMNRHNISVTADILYNNEEKFYRFDNTQISEDEVQRIDLQLFHTTLIAGEIAICKAVSGQDINSLLRYIANLELNVFLKATKKKISYKIKVEDESNFGLGSKVIIDDSDFICERINSFDNYNQTMEADFVEV